MRSSGKKKQRLREKRPCRQVALPFSAPSGSRPPHLRLRACTGCTPPLSTHASEACWRGKRGLSERFGGRSQKTSCPPPPHTVSALARSFRCVSTPSVGRGGDNRYPHPRAPLSRDDHHLSAQAGWAREALPTSPWCGAERQRSLLRIFLSHLLALLARPLAVGIDGDVGHGFVHLCVYVCVRRVCVCVCSRSRSTRRTRRVSLLLPLTKEARVREWKRKKGVGVRVRIQRLISLRRASPCRRGSPCLPTDPRLMRPPLHRASKHGKSFGRHTLARSTLEV